MGSRGWIWTSWRSGNVLHAQITLFMDGKARVKPLLIFRGKGKRISFREKVSHIHDACNYQTLHFNTQCCLSTCSFAMILKDVWHFKLDNAWCDEKVMREWIHQQWKPACSGDMLLALDVHKAQTTDAIQECLRKDCKIEPVFVPAGTTSLVQPVDVVFNTPFKAAVEREATKHFQENLSSYVERRINASERRVLFTKSMGWGCRVYS